MKAIYTSSWSTALPPTVRKIGVSRAVPRGYPAGYRRVRELEPGPWFNSVPPLEFHQRYMAQLKSLDAGEIVQKIQLLADGAEAAVLLCFESPNDPMAWCHRGQIAGWMHDRLKIEVREYGLEGCGCGWSHPKLFAKLRK
jgi:hypothetical protein